MNKRPTRKRCGDTTARYLLKKFVFLVSLNQYKNATYPTNSPAYKRKRESIIESVLIFNR